MGREIAAVSKHINHRSAKRIASRGASGTTLIELVAILTLELRIRNSNPRNYRNVLSTNGQN
jgi:hypothetical protein